MKIYHASLDAIQQQTLQLRHEQCNHCKRSHQLISHGFIRKKQPGGQPQTVGKRVFCSNRNNRTGCGRTIRLYLDSIVRYLHYAGARIAVFVSWLIEGMTIERAYRQATDAVNARNAYRWLNKFAMQLSRYRSLLHQAPWHKPLFTPAPSLRRHLLISTFHPLVQQLGQPLCSRYQLQLQRPFL